MKKFPMYLILTALFGMLMCCEVKVEPRKAGAAEIVSSGYVKVHYYKYSVAGIEYGVFYASGFGNDEGGGVSVVNLTKDKLEIEKMKLEIESLKTTKIN